MSIRSGEWFEIKVESCQKSRWILDVFLPHFVGGTRCKISVHVITPAGATSPGKVSWGYRYAHYPKDIGAHMWNFKPKFKCLPLKFLREPRLCLWCALASLDQCLARLKISGASAPMGRNSLSKSRLGWVQSTTLWIVEQISPDLFRRTQEKPISIKCLSDFGYLESLHSPSKSELV